MSQKATVVFTYKSVDHLLRDGGTSSWRLDRNHALQRAFVVCTRNANSKLVEGPEAHRSAFLVAKLRDVVPTGKEKDFLIQFSEIALVNISQVWKKGHRNPVRYSTLEELGIDPSTLKWQPMPRVAGAAEQVPEVGLPLNSVVLPLTMAEAKKGLAVTYSVALEAIEIIIRG